MHPSLEELTLEARRADSPAMARGILVETQELLRNALDHGEPETALAFWFSRTLQELALSPAVAELIPGSRMRYTGPVARFDAIPTDTISWMLIGEDPDANGPLIDLFEGTGLTVGDLSAPGTQADWTARAQRAVDKRDAGAVARYVDAGRLTDPALADLLIAPSLERRPPALRLAEGLPDSSTPVDVNGTLREPVVAVARWAGLLSEASVGDAPQRLAEARDRGILTEDEAAALTQAWETGLSMELRSWRHGTWGQEETMRSLPALDRSAYGAAARLVSVAMRSLAGRHGVAIG